MRLGQGELRAAWAAVHAGDQRIVVPVACRLQDRLVGDVGLQRVEIVDQGVHRRFLPGRLGGQPAGGGAQRVERETGADAVEYAGGAVDLLAGLMLGAPLRSPISNAVVEEDDAADPLGDRRRARRPRSSRATRAVEQPALLGTSSSLAIASPRSRDRRRRAAPTSAAHLQTRPALGSALQPQRRVLDDAGDVAQHLVLHRRRDLVVERLDRRP